MTNGDPVNVGRGWFSELHSGNTIFFEDPRMEDISEADIVHGLAYQCRYGGHTRRFYSIAEHCVLIAQWCRGFGYPAKDVYKALMHDAVEAYTLDIPRPLKACMPQYEEIEERVESVVNAVLGIPCPKPAWLKELDLRAIVDERAQAMADTGNLWDIDGMTPLGIQLQFYSPDDAKIAFEMELETVKSDMAEERKR